MHSCWDLICNEAHVSTCARVHAHVSGARVHLPPRAASAPNPKPLICNEAHVSTCHRALPQPRAHYPQSDTHSTPPVSRTPPQSLTHSSASHAPSVSKIAPRLIRSSCHWSELN
eukprot:2363215-Rhodomonas_salina.1